jgi:uncharacterized protein Yka (UPF0111/DUF47 family)
MAGYSVRQMKAWAKTIRKLNEAREKVKKGSSSASKRVRLAKECVDLENQVDRIPMDAYRMIKDNPKDFK